MMEANKKPNRKRDVHFHIWATEEEAALIRRRMADAGVTSLGAYFRRMAISGYHINLDLTDVRELVSLLRRCSNNLNQMVKRANETRSIYEADVEDLRRQYDKLWEAANGILEGLADAIKSSEIFNDNIIIANVSCGCDRLGMGVIADTLLNAEGIEASFALTQKGEFIDISARSLGKINVHVIMEKLGGGGHLNSAGGQVEGNMKETIEELKKAIDTVLSDNEQ